MTRVFTGLREERMACHSAIFGGTDIEEVARLVENGFVTWTDTGDKDEKAVVSQSALLVNAPLDIVFQTAVDFENHHKFISIGRRARVDRHDGRAIEVTLRQGFGLPFLSVGLEERFRLRIEPPGAVLFDAYLGGSFKEAHYEMFCFPLSRDRTLFILSFTADFRSLWWLDRFFLGYQPELEFGLAANVGVIPASEIVEEAERRAGRTPAAGGSPSISLWDAIGQGMLAPALEHGYVTLGRFDGRGEVMDMACAARLGLDREAAWNAVSDPQTLVKAVSFVEKGKTVERTDSRLRTELGYRVRLGPLSRTYEMILDADLEPMTWIRGRHARLNGLEVKHGNFFASAGPDTIFCHLFHTNVRQDWLMRLFLRNHEEFARVIATYGAVIVVHALRKYLGGPTAGRPEREGQPPPRPGARNQGS